MKFIDLFAGIGGFRLGMEMAGHECVGFCEIDKFAEKSYRAMYNTEGEWFADDIRTVDPRDMPDFDCLTGGFPCQSFSIAGKRGGFEDTRGTLFFEIARIIRERQPKLIFLENVKGLLNHDGGRTFGTILQTLWELGYDVEWQLLNSKDFGVPQNRSRVFIIGYPRGARRRKIFPIRGTDREVGRDIKRIASSKYYRRSYQTYDVNGSIEALDTMQGGGRQPHIKVIDKKGNLKQGNTKGQYASTLTGGGNSGGNHSDMDLIAQAVLTPDRLEKRQNGRRFKEDGEPMFTLTSQDRHGIILRPVRTEYGKSIRKKYESGEIQESRHNMTKLEPRPDDISNTLTSVQKDNLLLQNTRIRRLTPRECFRLQGFPDEYFDRARKVNSDSQLYKQAGNSVTVNVIYEVAKRL